MIPPFKSLPEISIPYSGLKYKRRLLMAIKSEIINNVVVAMSCYIAEKEIST